MNTELNLEEEEEEEEVKNSIIKVKDEFIQQVLIPYNDDCKYLKTLDIHVDDSEEGTTTYTAKANFGIDRSCYIDDTGHFNAVEYNISFNQLAYAFIGYGIQNDLLPELAVYKGDIFYEIQLSHFLLAKISSSYKKEIYAKDFQGEMRIRTLSNRSSVFFVSLDCDFKDDKGGSSKGNGLLALLEL